MLNADQWIGVGLDGCLATKVNFKRKKFPEDTEPEVLATYELEIENMSITDLMPIGILVPNMAKRVRNWIGSGYQVKILTGRAANPEMLEAVEQWLQENLPKDFSSIEVTNELDPNCIEIYGANCVRTQLNTGMLLVESPAGI